MARPRGFPILWPGTAGQAPCCQSDQATFPARRRSFPGPLLRHRRAADKDRSRSEPKSRSGSTGQLPTPRCSATDQAAIQLPCQADQRQPQSGAERRLEVPEVEALQRGMDQERGQQKIDDRCRRVFEAVIKTPVRRQGVEAVILDVPAGMAAPPETADRRLGLGRRRSPKPDRRLVRLPPLASEPNTKYSDPSIKATNRPCSRAASTAFLRINRWTICCRRQATGGCRLAPGNTPRSGSRADFPERCPPSD